MPPCEHSFANDRSKYDLGPQPPKIPTAGFGTVAAKRRGTADPEPASYDRSGVAVEAAG